MAEPFIQAVIDNDVEGVRSGLANGRDPNLPDQYGWIPLHRAAANDSAEVGEILLQAGSSLVATSTDDWTPLHLAAISGSSRMVKVLVAAGAAVDALSYCGDTPLHLAFYPESAETLLKAGANPRLPNHKGLTPLARAQNLGYNAVADVIRRWIETK
jgi:ankyrin repeat protein